MIFFRHQYLNKNRDRRWLNFGLQRLVTWWKYSKVKDFKHLLNKYTIKFEWIWKNEGIIKVTRNISILSRVRRNIWNSIPKITCVWGIIGYRMQWKFLESPWRCHQCHEKHLQHINIRSECDEESKSMNFKLLTQITSKISGDK